MLQATLPPQIKTLAAQWEDEMAEWVKRDPLRPRWDTLRHGERALHLMGDLIDNLAVVFGELRPEVNAYGKVVRRLAR